MKTLLLAASILWGVLPAAAQDDEFASIEIKAEALRGNLHVLYGGGGNIGVSAGVDGILLIDGQFAQLTDRIKTALARISDKPVRFVVNTHYHADHVGGNENFVAGNSIVLAHDNVRERLSERTVPAAALPVVTYSDEMSLHVNGEEVQLIHVRNAHTDGDTIVHFKGSNVVHMGDVQFNENLYPFIDVRRGGSIDGVISAVKSALEISDAETIVIPGHGPTTDRAGLSDYLNMLEGTRAIIAGMKANGKTVDEIRAAKPLLAYAKMWEGDSPEWTEQYIGFVYHSLDK